MLERQGFEALTTSDAEHGLSLARARRPALILVDINPPGMGGFELCRQIREFSDGHLIVLTERTDEVDPVAGMSAGVDDYLTKPFSTRTLAVRLEAMSHRRRRPAGTQRLRFGDLSIDPAGRQARLMGEVLDLTKTESLTAALAEVERRCGAVDVLVNNGGVSQRAMAAESMSAARRTPLIAAFPKMLFPILVIVPGMIAATIA